jgi:hypothetical protein
VVDRVTFDALVVPSPRPLRRLGRHSAAVRYVVVPLALRDPAAALFGALWLTALGFSGYWFLVRAAYRVDLHEHAVRWWTPLRSGVASTANS